jgi:hypothetical protein
MYDKAGSVVRVELVINSAEEFRVRKRVARHGSHVMAASLRLRDLAFPPRYANNCSMIFLGGTQRNDV